MGLKWAGSEMTATQTHRTVGFAGRSFVSAKKHEETEREAGALRRNIPQKARIGGFPLCCGVCVVFVLAFGPCRRFRRKRKPRTRWAARTAWAFDDSVSILFERGGWGAMGGVRAIDGVFRRGGGEREIQRRDRGAVDAWLAKGGTHLSLEARFLGGATI